MARQGVDIGVEGNDGTGDSIRESFRKVNENFQELYAVFGVGGQISFTDLSDTPMEYPGNENKIPVVRQDAAGLSFLDLVSDSIVDGEVDTIGFDFTVEGKLIVRQLVSRVSNDPQPRLSGPLNAATQPIAGVVVSQSAIDTFNSVYNTNYTIGDLVINKSFADRNYQTKTVPGGGVRLPDEPDTISQYTLTADGIDLFDLVINDHGLSDAFNGAGFIFNSTITDPFGVTSGGAVYIRIKNKDKISLYESQQSALDDSDRIQIAGGSGVFTITDAALDPALEGNWLDNIALPRKSIVRRQGDTMEGILTLSDHPGDLAGTGLPNGLDDLQAATKLYVDNASAASTVNLYVTTVGNDSQKNTPDGKQGRSPAYAYRTVNAAAEKAEEIIQAAPYEPGPYVQTITYNSGATDGVVVSQGITPLIANRINARQLITLNKEFVSKEVTAYIDATYPEFIGRYNTTTCERDVEYILDSVSLDSLLGNNANYLSRWAGIRYFSNASASTAIGSQRALTVAGINYARFLVVNHILFNTAPPVQYQSRVDQVIDNTIMSDILADETIDAKFDVVLSVIDQGVLNAPVIVDGLTNYKINISNGNYGFVDQANPLNADIIPGKVIQGKSSGAIGRIVDYKNESGDRAVSLAETDEVEVQLLEPTEFQDGETLEFGNIVRETQVSIRVETGVYEEDYPIRMSANVSIKGDEFRRVIIRPKKRVSQSRWANLYFYRDAQFDGLVLGRSIIESVSFVASTDASRTPGNYTVDNTGWTSNNLGKDAVFEVNVNISGTVTDVTVLTPGVDFIKDELITISDSALGAGGADPVILIVSRIPNGVEYVNPLTGKVDGYFGYHYLEKPNQQKQIGAGYPNVGSWKTSALSLVDNREFIQEQVVEYLDDQFSIFDNQTDKTAYFEGVGQIVDALIKDMRLGGNEFSLEAQGEYYVGQSPTNSSPTTATIAGIQYIATIANKIIRGQGPDILYGTDNQYETDLFNGDTNPDEWSSSVRYQLGIVVSNTVAGTTRYYIPTIEHVSGGSFSQANDDGFWREIDGPELVISNLITTIAFAFEPNYRPPLRNNEMDVFLMDDATIIRNVTVQGHGGFMLALDPEGQVLTKSPYIQTGSSFSRSLNKQSFRGGMFVDAFVGNTAVQVSDRIDGSAFRLSIQSFGSQAEPQGLFVRRPQTPCAFYVDGRRFQVNAVTNYDPDLGSAELILDPSSNDGQGFTGITSQLLTGVDLDAIGGSETPIPITLQTAGNRSILGNDFTQINDLGYGLVVLNGALSEMVSMFTYYCWTSYYAANGGQIRSIAGSSCYGEYGLIAEGADPNEIPDAVELLQDMAQPAKSFTADVVLIVTNPIQLTVGDVVQQANSDAIATVSASTSQTSNGGTGSTTVYLKNPTGIFNTADQLTLDPQGTASTLGPNSIPVTVNAVGYGNDVESLSIYVYDMKDVPSNRSEIDLYHPTRNVFARYEVANVENTGEDVGAYLNVGTDIFYNYITGGAATGTASGAIFTIRKTINGGYTATIENGGNDYRVDDSFNITGSLLGGQNGTHDCTIAITAIDNTEGNGIITGISVTGIIYIEPTTPTVSNTVYRLNFSTGDAQFSDNGLLEEVAFDTIIQYRRNSTHILGDVARTGLLTIRPSTAIIFDENPEFVYRSVSFLTSDSLGNELESDQLQTGFDTSYDYIRLLVDSQRAGESTLSGTGTTKGSTIGDTRIALLAASDFNEIFRLNNNLLTPQSNRPVGWTADSLTAIPPIIAWAGKQHYVYNFRGVKTIGGVETEVAPAEDNDYAIVDIQDVGIDINYPLSAEGLAGTTILGNSIVTIRAGLKAGSIGDITVNISTCRVTGHDFLDIGTGGYNSTNYPNVLFGEPSDKNSANEVDERGKGRVFYVSTDQDGVFRVGRFFSVDQGTGTVTFSASIALSDVDGIGFKRGVVVTEFSTDTAMTDNASDTVPTELAVRGYINRRLGYDVSGNAVSNRLGPGALAPNGSIPLTGDLNAANNTISNLGIPSNAADAATKRYVDNTASGGDEIRDMRSISYNSYQSGQVLSSTGAKRLVLPAGSVVAGPYVSGDVITGSVTGATGEIVEVIEETGSVDGDIVILVYIPLSGEFSDGTPAGNSPGQDRAEVLPAGAQGIIIDGPIDEWANVLASASSDISIATGREEINLQIKAGVIINADVNANAGIAQSKLALVSASTRANPAGISQSDLGSASFDSAVFDSTTGWITINNGALSINKLQRISNGTVLGNWSGDDGASDIDEVSFSDVIAEGLGLEDRDFTGAALAAASDPGQALIRTGTGTYSISNVTNTGETNSILKTNASGSIQVNSLILGGNPSYEILSLNTTTVLFKTPTQGEILRSVGGSPSVAPTVQIPGGLNIGDSNSTQSVLKVNSTLAGKKAIGVNWIYSSFIEAQDEKGAASTGISIGAASGVSAAGEVAIVTADSSSNTSVIPFTFSSAGVLPDVTNTYDIGSNSLRYRNMYSSGNLFVNGASIVAGEYTGKGFLPDATNTYDIGSAALKYDNVYANIFNGTATTAYYADLAENYQADAAYEAGTVLVFGGDAEVTTTNQKDNFRAAGVVSTNPAHLMNTALSGENVVALALQGRVPCKVVGKVSKGDIIVTSGIFGYGCVNNNPVNGTMIGKAVGSKDTNDRGTVEVVIGR